MISAWHLLWILPLTGSLGFGLAACLMVQAEPLKENPQPWDPDRFYGYGDLISHRGKILRCEIPSRSYAESWDPDLYPLAWEEVEQ